MRRDHGILLRVDVENPEPDGRRHEPQIDARRNWSTALITHARLINLRVPRRCGEARCGGTRLPKPGAEKRLPPVAESRRRDEYEGAFADVARALGPLLSEARARGLVPPDARVVPLADADLAPVAQLHVRHFGGDIDRALRMLGGAPPWRYDPRISFVVLQGEQALGYTLGRLMTASDRRVCLFDYTAIDPRHRGGWPNLLLRAHATDALLRAGVEVYRYCATDRHADSRRVARRVNARLLRTTVRLARSSGA